MLPNELWLIVLEFLPAKTVLSIASVCTTWAAFARDAALWKAVLGREFGCIPASVRYAESVELAVASRTVRGLSACRFSGERLLKAFCKQRSKWSQPFHRELDCFLRGALDSRSIVSRQIYRGRFYTENVNSMEIGPCSDDKLAFVLATRILAELCRTPGMHAFIEVADSLNSALWKTLKICKERYCSEKLGGFFTENNGVAWNIELHNGSTLYIDKIRAAIASERYALAVYFLA